jgi:hypothetical protein
MAPGEAGVPNPYPLYNTTFTLQRLSPLYTGLEASLDNATLLPYARRFRDILVGDVLRGVRVGLGSDEDVLARVGALQTVSWKILAREDAWDSNAAADDSQMDEAIEFAPGRGVYVNITYERASYVAILLRGKKAYPDGEGHGFERFPLLLTRMPGSLRDTFTEFLESSFDARVSPLRMGWPYLPSALESYVRSCLVGEDGEETSLEEGSATLKKILKDVQVVIGFDLPSGNASLKTIDIIIARDDLPRFLQRGSKIPKTSTAKDKMPFMDALTLYVHTHLALNLKHEDVNILRVACGAFVLGAEGKAKLTEPTRIDEDNVQSRATEALVDDLVQLAEGAVMSKVGNPR